MSEVKLWRGQAPMGWGPDQWNLGVLHPRVDLVEEEAEFVVLIELPGVKKKDIQLTVQEHLLTVTGEQFPAPERRKGNFRIMERGAGAFRRSISLPDAVDEEAATAEFEDGLLTVHLPKRAPSRAPGRSIPIEGA